MIPHHSSATPCIQQGLKAPVSQQYLSDVFSLVYAYLFSHLSVCVSGSLCFFHSFSLTWPIVVSAPGAEQTAIPRLSSDRQREGGKKKKDRKMREWRDCVSVSSPSPPFGETKTPSGWNAGADPMLRLTRTQVKHFPKAAVGLLCGTFSKVCMYVCVCTSLCHC